MPVPEERTTLLCLEEAIGLHDSTEADQMQFQFTAELTLTLPASKLVASATRIISKTGT